MSQETPYTPIEGEIWKPIVSKELKGYEVSSIGRIRRMLLEHPHSVPKYVTVSLIRYKHRDTLSVVKGKSVRRYSLLKLACLAFKGFPKNFTKELYIENIYHRVDVSALDANKFDANLLDWRYTRAGGRPVTVTDMRNGITRKYDTVNSMLKDTGISATSLYRACRPRDATALSMTYGRYKIQMSTTKRSEGRKVPTRRRNNVGRTFREESELRAFIGPDVVPEGDCLESDVGTIRVNLFKSQRPEGAPKTVWRPLPSTFTDPRYNR